MQGPGGGREMMERTVGEVGDFCFRSNLPVPHIIGVTVLTSSNADTLRAVGVERTVGEQVALLARLAQASRMNGVVASSNEIDVIRGCIVDPNFLIVTLFAFCATKDDQNG